MSITHEPHPLTSAQPPAGAPPRQLAGFWRRVGANLLDSIVIDICWLPLAFLNSWLAIPGFVLIYAAYYISLEGGPNGQTVGKMALGIRVIDVASDEPIGHYRAFIRCAGRILSGAFLLGYLWMLWNEEKQTWHDKMARSVVVSAPG